MTSREANSELHTRTLPVNQAGEPVDPPSGADLAALAALIDGNVLKVAIAEATATIVADIVDLDVDAITGEAPNNATLYDLEQLLTTIDTDTGTMAADLTTLAGIDFAAESGGNLDDIAARLLRAAAPAAGELPEADASVAELVAEGLFDSEGFGAGTSLATISQSVAKSAIGDDTIADILENAFGLSSPFYGDPGGGTVGLTAMLADAFSGAGTWILPPPFHDSTNYNTMPDILLDAFTGAGVIAPLMPFHDSTNGMTVPDILMDVYTGGGALADPNVFIDNTGFSSVADLLYSIDAQLALQAADIGTIQTDIAAIKAKTDQFNFYNGGLSVATLGEQP